MSKSFFLLAFWMLALLAPPANAAKAEAKPFLIFARFLQDTEVQLDELSPRLKAITAAKPDTRIFVKGDSGINYGRVMEVMGQLGAAGFPHVALLTQPAPSKGAH